MAVVMLFRGYNYGMCDAPLQTTEGARGRLLRGSGLR